MTASAIDVNGPWRSREGLWYNAVAARTLGAVGSSRLSRRGLFALGIARAAGESAPPRVVSRPAAPAAPGGDRAEWSERQLQAWARRDDGGLWGPAIDALVGAAGPLAGARVLDAAASTGAVTRANASRGAVVIAAELADLTALPFPDDDFDCALSAFGPMFALDARAALGELFRVVRPGGLVVFTAWTAGGVVGRLLRLAAAHDPLPRGIPAPLSWGRDERLRQDLEVYSDDVSFEHRALELRFADHDDAVDRLTQALHPLSAVADAESLRAAALAAVGEAAAGEGDGAGPSLRAPYVVARAVRRIPPAPVLY